MIVDTPRAFSTCKHSKIRIFNDVINLFKFILTYCSYLFDREIMIPLKT